MRLNELEFTGPPPIDGYGPGGFRVAGTWYEGPLLLLPSSITAFAGLTDAGIAPIVEAAAELDVLLIGMGAEISALDAGLRQLLEAAEVGTEVMSTPSACRTYNVLLAEDRRAAAALIPV